MRTASIREAGRQRRGLLPEAAEAIAKEELERIRKGFQ